MKYICTSCNCTTLEPKLKGNGWIELILWLAYIIPGLIYSIWRRGSAPNLCPTCDKSTLAPYSEGAVPDRAVRTCPRCAEQVKAAALVCRYCSTDLPALPEPVVPEPVVAPDPEPEGMSRAAQIMLFIFVLGITLSFLFGGKA